MPYQIEFIRDINARSDPEVIHVRNGQFTSVAAALEQGKLLLATTDATRRANGFRIREDGGRIVALWSRGGL